jgi:hypothetical protein
MRKEVRYVGQNKQLGEAARGKGKHHPHWEGNDSSQGQPPGCANDPGHMD